MTQLYQVGNKNLKGIYGASGQNQECNIWFKNGWKNETTPFTIFKALKSESCFLATSSFGHFKYFNVSSKVFEIMTSVLAYIKCQIIFYNTAREEMGYLCGFGIISFYFPPLEVVHRVFKKLYRVNGRNRCLQFDKI